MSYRPEQTKNDDKKDLVKAESTYVDPAVTSKKQIKDWILVMLGYPLVTVELSDDQLNICIQNALEKYTKYAHFQDKYLIANLRHYQDPMGLDLKEFKIASIKSIAFARDNAFALNNDLFWGSYAFLGNGGYNMFSGFGTGAVGAWTTWHSVNEFFQLSHQMTGLNPHWQYDKSTGFLQMMPKPKAQRDSFILLTCNCIPPLEELYGNEYVKRLALAQAKMLLGVVRSKFQNVQLIGGGNINTEIGAEGKEEWNQLIENIIKDESVGQSWFIC